MDLYNRSLIAAIGTDFFDEWEASCHLVKDEGSVIAILDVGTTYLAFEDHSKRLNENLALAVLDFLSGVKPHRVTHVQASFA